MEIKQGDQQFYVKNDQGKKIASITYQQENDDIIVANSTYVDPSLRGQGVAKKLLDRLAEHAREHNLQIRPLCSYVVKAFEAYSQYDDVKIR